MRQDTALWIDDALQRRLGLPYLRLTRDALIHQRSRYLAAFLRDRRQGDRARPRLLDAGCGSGIALRYVDGLVSRYVGFDRHTARLQRRYRDLRTPHEFHDIDFDRDWRLPAADVAWCAEVLEHLQDDAGALRKLAEHVAPGGYVLLTMPSLPFVERHRGHVPALAHLSATQDGGHVRSGYDRAAIHALAARSGLTVERIDAISRFSPTAIERHYRERPWRPLLRAWYALRARAPYTLHATDEELRAHHSIAAVLRRNAP